MTRVVVGCDELLADGVAVVEKIAAAVSADWSLRGEDFAACGLGASSQSLPEQIGSFLSPDLRHHVVHHVRELAAFPLLALALETFSIMTDVANGQPSIQHQRRLDAVRAELDHASALFPSLICLHQQWGPESS